MDSQYKNGAGNENGVTNDYKKVAVANKKKLTVSSLVLRFLALAFSFAAALVLGLNNKTTMVAVSLIPSLPPLDIPVTAKWHYLSANLYFVVANAIACAYAAISLLLTLATRGRKNGLAALIVIFDLVMVALLFSSIGAAGSIGYMGYKGNTHVKWAKVCNVFGAFCRQGIVAMGLSAVASLLFFFLVVVAILKLHKSRH